MMQNILWYYTMDIEQHYIDLYKVMHQDKKTYQGISLQKEIPNIANLVLVTNSETVLDYGCGKGNQYIESHLNILFHIKDENIYMYDPCFPEHSKLPKGKFDGVISTDVMEHIPEDIVPKALDTIYSKAKKFVYLAICTRLAHAILPNGENAHCTVKEPDWWEKHIIKSNKNKIHTEVHWYGNHNDYRKYNTSS